MKIKDKILILIQKELPLSYETIKQVYKITNSYDIIITLSDMAVKFNKNIIELAWYLYKDELLVCGKIIPKGAINK